MARKIYISSTYGDLRTYREKLADTIRFLRDHFELVRIMEYMMPGSPDTLPDATGSILEACLKDVRESEIYVLIIGKRYGSVEPASGLSYTENEYREAKRHGKKIIALLADETAPDFRDIQTDNPAEFERFKGEVQGANLTFIKGFTNADHLSNQLLLALYPHADQKWEVRDEVRYFCNREDQFLSFITFKERERLNVFTLICKKHDQSEFFNHRMAKAEFGLREEHVKTPLVGSSITAVYHSYDKHKRLIIGHMMKNFIPRLENMPKTVRECVAHYKQKNRDNIYIELKLSKTDAESQTLISSLINFLNELNDECEQARITMFFVLTFEFSNDEAAVQEVVNCIDGKTSFEILRLGVLDKIGADHVKEWLKHYITLRDEKFIDGVLADYYTKEISAYSMYDLFPLLDPIIKKTVA